MSSWYFVKDGQRNGPMRREELDARIAEGVVDADTLVWAVGMASWLRADALPELGLARATPPPLPGPPPLPFAPTSASNPTPTAAGDAGADEPTWTESEPARAPAARVEFAGFWARLAAKLIDWVVLYGFGVMVERAVTALAFDGVLPAPPDWESLLRFLMISAPINTAIALLYSVYFMARHEATPGKRMLGLRVVRADGGRVGTARVIGRYFAETVSTIVFFAGYVMAAFDDEKRTLHDMMCDTRVVKGPRETSTEGEPGRRREGAWRDSAGD